MSRISSESTIRARLFSAREAETSGVAADRRIERLLLFLPVRPAQAIASVSCGNVAHALLVIGSSSEPKRKVCYALVEGTSTQNEWEETPLSDTDMFDGMSSDDFTYPGQEVDAVRDELEAAGAFDDIFECES